MMETIRLGRSTVKLGLVLCAILATTIACSLSSTRNQNDLMRINGTLSHDGIERQYTILAPDHLDVERSYPLVLALHGGGGDGERMCSLRGGIQELVGQEGFITVCPSGVEKHWNDGRDIDSWRAHAENIDDVGFLLDLISMIATDYPVDMDRIFVTGMSNGGKMSLRMACEANEIFKAAAPVIASLPADLNCSPSNPISIFIMNGTEDPLVPWEGGQVTAFGQPLGEALSTPDTVAFWVEHNGCDPEPERSELPDVVAEDGSRIRIERYPGCPNKVEVTLFQIVGGGHTWPGGVQYLPEFLIGRTNRDIRTADVIWEFFERSSE